VSLLTTISNLKKRDDQRDLLILGLDNSGKTSILYRLADEDTSGVEPTQGFNSKTITWQSFTINMRDIGGSRDLRPSWRNYFSGSTGLVYVVDSADRARIGEAGQELDELLAESQLAGLPLLVYANKQDLPMSMRPEAIAEELSLGQIRDRPSQIQGCSAMTGDGLIGGLEWMLQA
jgi:ADP-ribosylation factor-like protein 3